jgi:hypothetical protein
MEMSSLRRQALRVMVAQWQRWHLERLWLKRRKKPRRPLGLFRWR